MNASDLPGEPVKAFCFSELRRTGWGLHTQAALRKPERMKVLELQPLSLSLSQPPLLLLTALFSLPRPPPLPKLSVSVSGEEMVRVRERNSSQFFSRKEMIDFQSREQSQAM